MSDTNYGELIQETSRGAVYKVNTDYGVIYDIRNLDGYLLDSTPVKSDALAHINDTDWIAEYRKEHIVSLPLADDAYAVIDKYLHGEEGFTDKDGNYHKFGVALNELEGGDDYDIYLQEIMEKYPIFDTGEAESVTDDDKRKDNIFWAICNIRLFAECGYGVYEDNTILDPQNPRISDD